jgi:O-antigen ligase
MEKKFKVIENYLLFGFAVTIPLPIIILNNIIIFLSIGYLIFKCSHIKNIKLDPFLALAYLSIFVIIALGLTYTENISYGFKFLERNLAFLFYPIFFSNIVVPAEFRIKHLLAFSISSLLVAVSNEINFLITSDYLLHSTFNTLYLNIAFITLCYSILKLNTSIGKALFILLSGICIFLIFQTESTMQLLIFVLSFILLLISLKFRILKSTIILASIGIIAYTLFLVSGLNEQHVKKFRNFIYTTDYIRARNWENHIPVIKENFFLGVGTGDNHKALNKYRETDWLEYHENYNSHNQYLEYLVRFGIVGLVIFIITLWAMLIKSFQRKDDLFTLLLIVFILTMVTESILSRQKGISGYVFITSLCLLTPPKKDEYAFKK